MTRTFRKPFDKHKRDTEKSKSASLAEDILMTMLEHQGF